MGSLKQVEYIRRNKFLEGLIDISKLKKLKKIKHLSTREDIFKDVKNVKPIDMIRPFESTILKIEDSGYLVKVSIRKKKPIYLNTVELLRAGLNLTNISSEVLYCDLRNIKISEMSMYFELFKTYEKNITLIDKKLKGEEVKILSETDEKSLLILKFLNKKASEKMNEHMDFGLFFTSIRHISDELKISKSTVHRKIEKLKEKGFINVMVDSKGVQSLRETSIKESKGISHYKSISKFSISKII